MNTPRILMVENNAIIRSIMSERLREAGAEVILAESGAHALDLSCALPFDVVIIDDEMCSPCALDFCRSFKEIPSKERVPIVLLNSREGQGDLKAFFSAGVSMCFTKSSPFQEILRFVLELVPRHSVLRKRAILVIDDSVSVRKAVETELVKSGFTVVTAANGKEGLERLDASPPDLILVDLNMPIMDGFTFSEMLRARPRHSNIPFVVISDENNRSVMRGMLQQGAAGYLIKPFNLDQLVVMVEKLLSDSYLLLLKENERLELERNMMLGSILSLAQALEARDIYTRHHSESVAALGEAMARVLGLDEEAAARIHIASRLHDIGKIGTPDRILLKPGPLTREEFEIIKRHPGMGAEILSPIPSLADIAPIVAGHHERFDGKGYPNRLKGQAIPLWARLLAVADTYNALTSDRPYRDGISHDQAMDVLRKGSGTQFCPESCLVFEQTVASAQSPLLTPPSRSRPTPNACDAPLRP